MFGTSRRGRGRCDLPTTLMVAEGQSGETVNKFGSDCEEDWGDLCSRMRNQYGRNGSLGWAKGESLV